MSVSDLVVTLLLIALAGYSVVIARTAWRDPNWQPLGRGWRFSPRAVVARAIILISITVLMAGVTIASATTGADARTITAAVGLPGIVGVLAGGLLAVTLTSAGWPASLVPPSLRAGAR
jgi:hypothetical protein